MKLPNLLYILNNIPTPRASGDAVACRRTHVFDVGIIDGCPHAKT
jgi:hypothetical protein